MKNKLTANQTLKLLKNELPLCFKKGAKKLPLSLNIHQEILQHYGKDKRIDEKVLKKAIQFYTQSTNYLKKLQSGAYRIDIKGQAKAVVNNFEAKYAENILKKRKSQKLHFSELE